MPRYQSLFVRLYYRGKHWRESAVAAKEQNFPTSTLSILSLGHKFDADELIDTVFHTIL